MVRRRVFLALKLSIQLLIDIHVGDGRLSNLEYVVVACCSTHRHAAYLSQLETAEDTPRSSRGQATDAGTLLVEEKINHQTIGGQFACDCIIGEIGGKYRYLDSCGF